MLAAALQENRSLTELDLSYNAVKPSAALCLASALKANTSLRFLNLDGNPVGLLCRYEMITPAEFDRFLRFMSRYAEANGLGFNKA